MYHWKYTYNYNQISDLDFGIIYPKRSWYSVKQVNKTRCVVHLFFNPGIRGYYATQEGNLLNLFQHCLAEGDSR